MASKTDEEIQLQETLEFLQEVLEQEKGLKTINKYGGKGGFGLVLFVESNEDPSKRYAVKAQNIINPNTGRINQSSQKMCEDEAEMMRQCQHKNVVEIHSDYIIGFYHFIQMNLCKCSLSDWIENNQSPINDILFLHYTNQIIDGLEYLHNKEYVLRDLSVRNILLTTDGIIKLCDFGLAKKYDETLKSKILYTSAPKGVLFYLPPEIYEDINKNKTQIKQTKKGDIWALGICLALLGGAKIFSFFNVHDANFQIPKTQNISERAEQVIKYILNRDPDQRPTINQIREKICEIFLNNMDQNQNINENINLINQVQPQLENIKSQEDLTNQLIIQNPINSASSLKIERLFDFNFVLCEKIYQKYSKSESLYSTNIDFLLTLGFLEAKYKSNYQKAIKLFEKVLNLDENETDAYIGLCHCIMQTRDYRNFAKLLSYSEICLHKDPKNWRALYYKSYYYYVNQNKQDLQVLEQIQLDNPECCEALSLKLLALYYTKYEDQQDLVDKLIALNKNSNPIVYFRLGSYFMDRDEMQKSQHYYKKSLDLTPNELSSLIGCADIQKENEQEVQKLIQKATQLYPQNSYLFRWKSKFEKNEQQQLELIKQSIELDPFNIWVVEDMANLLKEQKKFQESIKYYEKILVINPDHQSAYYKMAKIYGQELKEYEKAKELYKKCIKMDPNDTSYFEELTNIYMIDKQYDPQVKIIKDNLEKSNQKQYLYKLLAYIEYEFQHYELFIQYIDKSLELDPKDKYCLNMYGKYFKLIKEDKKKAKEYFLKIYELDPKYEELYFNLAYVEEDDMEKKKKYYNKQIEINPQHSQSVNNLGVIYDNDNNNEEALRLFKMAFQINQDDEISSSNIASKLYDLNQYDQALEQCKTTLKLDPNNSKTYKIQGDIYSDRKEYRKAIQNYLQAIENDSSKTFLYKSIAYQYEQLNELNEALKYYQKHVQFHPKNCISLYKVGFLQYKINNDLNEAITYLKKSIEAEASDNAQAYKELGLLYLKKDQHYLAKENLLKAIQQDSSNKGLYLNLSKNEKDNIKNIQQSITYLEEFIKFDPSNQDEKINLIKLHIQEKQYQKARQLISKFIMDHPQNSQGYFQQGYLEFEENNYIQAINSYDKSFQLNSNEDHCIYNIGLSYERLENYNKALEYYQKHITLSKEDPKPLYSIGFLLLIKLKNPKRAIKYFKKSQEFEQKSNNKFNQNYCFYYLGDCFVQLNYISEAVDQFKKYLLTNPDFNLQYCKDYIKNNENAPKKYYQYKTLEDSDSDEEDVRQILSQANQQALSGNLNQAIQNYKSALDKNSTTKTKEKLADAYLKNKQYQNALQLYEEIINKKPTLTYLFENIAKSYEGLCKFQQAFEFYQKSFNQNPQSFFSCHKIGYLYQTFFKSTQSAKEFYKKSYNLNPVGLSINLIQLAKIFYEEKNYKESIKYFEEAYQLENNNVQIINFLIEIFKVGQRDNEKVIFYMNKKLKLEKEMKEQIKILFEIAEIEEELKKYDNSVQLYQQILQREQNNNQALYKLGLNQKYLNKAKESIETQLQLIKINPDFQMSYFEIGYIELQFNKKPKQTIKFLRKSIELNQNHTESHYYLGLAFDQRGYKYEALQCFYQVQKLSPNHEKQYIENYILNNKNAKEKKYKATNIDDSDCNIF
ncbi:hypothetical protein ABPG74_018612 [Tetrahymena malaccensis]